MKPKVRVCRLRSPAAWGLGVKPCCFDDRAHALDGGAADALLFGLAIDDVAGGGHGHTGQLGDITEFQPGISLFFRACRDIFANPNRFRQTTIVSTHPTSWASRMQTLSSNVPIILD